MPEAIVFDFDGVIVDSEPLHHRAFVQVLEPYGVTFSYEQYLEQFVGFDDRDCFRAILSRHGPGDRLGSGDSKTIRRLCELKAEAFEAIVAEGFDPIPGVLAFIGHLHDRLPLAIASGASRADVTLLLDKLRLVEHFNPVVTADDVEKSKPDPACYRLAVEGLARRAGAQNVTAAGCLAIEDTPAGIESARGAGLRTLGVATTHSPEMLLGADRVIESFEDWDAFQLLAWFDSMGRNR